MLFRARPTTSTVGASMPTSGTRHFRLRRRPAAPAALPASKCTRNRVKGVKSLVGETSAAQANVYRLLHQGLEPRIADPHRRAHCPPFCYRIHLRFEFQRLGNLGSGFIDFSVEAERPRKHEPDPPDARIFRPRLPFKMDRSLCMTQEE